MCLRLGKPYFSKVTLSDAPCGQELRFVSVDLDADRAFRLRELGFAPGVVVRVVQRAAFGGRVIAIRGERMAVDGATARRITLAA